MVLFIICYKTCAKIFSGLDPVSLFNESFDSNHVVLFFFSILQNDLLLVLNLDTL